MTKSIRSHTLVFLFSVFLMAGYNQSLWHGILQSHGHFTWHNAIFLTTCALFLTAIINFVLSIVAVKPILKPILILIVISSAIASFFMDNYGVFITTDMMQNVWETDQAEATELLNFAFFEHFVLWGLLPAWLISRIDIKHGGWIRQVLVNIISMASSLLVVGAIALFFYQDYASMFRNHRELRYLINPTNYIYAITKSVTRQFEDKDKKLIPISQHVTHGNIAQDKKRRTIGVVVVGETARAQEFHLNGYQRQTTPMLEKHTIFNFSRASSCGTETAVSVPCMFSKFGRDDYSNDKGHGYETILDVLAAGGIDVVWRDNNSGCKGVCDRVTYQEMDNLNLPKYCHHGECYDEALLQGLDKVINSTDKDMLIVLHQKGSHGPAYYLRAPEKFWQYKPVCKTSELQKCTNQELVNAYDNTILYTDYNLSQVIDYLKGLSDKDDTVMMYMSDHGESLGENNLYLHGTPYFMAPSQQTHIPMIMWMSESYEQDYHINTHCMEQLSQQPVSHDNLFHSLQGMLDVYAQDSYNKKLDLFSLCRIKQ